MKETFDFNAVRNLSDADMITFLNSLYAAGYASGHHHTVESSYSDVHPDDKGTYFFDDVSDFVIDYFPRQPDGNYMDDPEYIQGNLDAFECAKCHSLFGFDCICNDDEGEFD